MHSNYWSIPTLQLILCLIDIPIPKVVVENLEHTKGNLQIIAGEDTYLLFFIHTEARYSPYMGSSVGLLLTRFKYLLTVFSIPAISWLLLDSILVRLSQFPIRIFQKNCGLCRDRAHISFPSEFRLYLRYSRWKHRCNFYSILGRIIQWIDQDGDMIKY